MNHIQRILYVEDDENDRFLMTVASRQLDRSIVLICLMDGEEAIRYLMGEGKYADREAFPFPTLIIIDLNMPGRNGFDVLEFLRHNPAWSVIPRIIFSNSCDEDDVKKAFMLGASAYHAKGMGAHSSLNCLRLILEYWKHCEIPKVDTTGRLLITDSRGKLGERYQQPKGGSCMERVPTLRNN